MKKYFSEQIRRKASDHAERMFPVESCGIVQGDEYNPCENIHVDPENNFEIDAAEYFEFLKIGPVQAIIHSHNSSVHPSKTDMESQLRTNVPWGVVNVKNGHAFEINFWGDSLPIQDLLNRPYITGIYDCYSLCRDYYRKIMDITLPPFPREPGWWSAEGAEEVDLGVNSIGALDCREIELEDMQPHDGLLFRLSGSKVVSHSAIYLGGGLILHHLYGRLSARHPLKNYRKYLAKAIRYKEL